MLAAGATSASRCAEAGCRWHSPRVEIGPSSLNRHARCPASGLAQRDNPTACRFRHRRCSCRTNLRAAGARSHHPIRAMRPENTRLALAVHGARRNRLRAGCLRPHGRSERAYADAPKRVRNINWAQDVAFVEHHSHDRLVIRGSFAGHYVDADDYDGFIGARTAEGALAGGGAGLLSARPDSLPGSSQAVSLEVSRPSTPVPRLRSALFDKLRAEVPEGCSAIIQLAPPDMPTRWSTRWTRKAGASSGTAWNRKWRARWKTPSPPAPPRREPDPPGRYSLPVRTTSATRRVVPRLPDVVQTSGHGQTWV